MELKILSERKKTIPPPSKIIMTKITIPIHPVAKEIIKENNFLMPATKDLPAFIKKSFAKNLPPDFFSQTAHQDLHLQFFQYDELKQLRRLWQMRKLKI